jgi:hypothetical protein
MCAVVLKKAVLDVLSNPALKEFIKMNMEIPRSTPTMATVVIFLPEMKYVVAIFLLMEFAIISSRAAKHHFQ